MLNLLNLLLLAIILPVRTTQLTPPPPPTYTTIISLNEDNVALLAMPHPLMYPEGWEDGEQISEMCLAIGGWSEIPCFEVEAKVGEAMQPVGFRPPLSDYLSAQGATVLLQIVCCFPLISISVFSPAINSRRQSSDDNITIVIVFAGARKVRVLLLPPQPFKFNPNRRSNHLPYINPLYAHNVVPQLRNKLPPPHKLPHDRTSRANQRRELQHTPF